MDFGVNVYIWSTILHNTFSSMHNIIQNQHDVMHNKFVEYIASFRLNVRNIVQNIVSLTNIVMDLNNVMCEQKNCLPFSHYISCHRLVEVSWLGLTSPSFTHPLLSSSSVLRATSHTSQEP